MKHTKKVLPSERFHSFIVQCRAVKYSRLNSYHFIHFGREYALDECTYEIFVPVWTHLLLVFVLFCFVLFCFKFVVLSFAHLFKALFTSNEHRLLYLSTIWRTEIFPVVHDASAVHVYEQKNSNVRMLFFFTFHFLSPWLLYVGP